MLYIDLCVVHVSAISLLFYTYRVITTSRRQC